MPETKARTRKKDPTTLEIQVTKEQVLALQRHQAMVNDVHSKQNLYIQAIIDSAGGIEGEAKVAGPIQKGNKWFLQVEKMVNPKKNGEV